MPRAFDWWKSCSGNDAQKSAFHREARSRLRKLADAMKLDAGSYDLRSNMAGSAISGEVTLHHEKFYLQVSQPSFGGDRGILLRTCEGRKDYSGGRNNMLPLSRLDDLAELAADVRRVQPDVATHAQIEEDLGYLPGTM